MLGGGLRGGSLKMTPRPTSSCLLAAGGQFPGAPTASHLLHLPVPPSSLPGDARQLMPLGQHSTRWWTRALASSPASVGWGQAEAGPTPHPGAQQEGALVTHTPAHSLTWTLSTPLPVNPLPHRASWATSQLAPWLKPLPRALPLGGTQAKDQHMALS